MEMNSNRMGNHNSDSESHSKEIIAVVGAGGKTTWIHRQAALFARHGKKVLITTTTHMYVEEDMYLWNNRECQENNLSKAVMELSGEGYLVAGMKCEDDPMKFTGLPDEIAEVFMREADVVLVEADGSRRLPLKYPSEIEPVIPNYVNRVVVLMGEQGIGKPAGEVLHRFELMGIDRERLVTEVMVSDLFEIYEKKIRKLCPNAEIEKYLVKIVDGEMIYDKFE